MLFATNRIKPLRLLPSAQDEASSGVSVGESFARRTETSSNAVTTAFTALKARFLEIKATRSEFADEFGYASLLVALSVILLSQLLNFDLITTIRCSVIAANLMGLIMAIILSHYERI